MIDIKYETLLVVYEEKNFTKAALKLNLTQPAVSHHIKELEKEFGKELFIRKKGDVIPTPFGEFLINYAKRFNALHEKMIDEAKHFDDNNINLKIGITHTAESNKITETIASFLTTHQGITSTIITETTDILYQMIDTYELDLAIVDKKRDNNLNYQELNRDYLVCVLNNESKLAMKKSVSIDDLKKEKLILRLPTSTTRMLFDSSLESINESIENFNVILEVDNIATIKDLIRKNMGISILAKSACMDEVNKNKITILPIENLSMERKNYLIYSNYFKHIKIVQELITEIQKNNDLV